MWKGFLTVLSVDEMLRISVWLLFRSAGFVGRVQFDSGDAQNTVGHAARPLDVRTFILPTSRRTDDAHDMLPLCTLTRRVSQ